MSDTLENKLPLCLQLHASLLELRLLACCYFKYKIEFDVQLISLKYVSSFAAISKPVN